MTEVLHDQNEQRDPRPIGRFLLHLDDFKGENDPFAYATQFAARPGNFQKFKHKSAQVGAETVNERGVELQFMISRFAYIWKIIVAADYYGTEHLHTGSTPLGMEQYEIHCSQDKSHVKYYEYNVQRTVIREQESSAENHLAKLQGLVEHMSEK